MEQLTEDTEEIQRKELYVAYFQDSHEYYIHVLDRYESGKKWVFNPYAFLMGIFWFLYRKCYREVLVIYLAVFAESFIEPYIYYALGIRNISALSFFVNIATAVIIGFLANQLYIRKASKAVNYARTHFSEQEKQVEYLYKKGGTTYTYVFVPILLVLLYVLLLNVM